MDISNDYFINPLNVSEIKPTCTSKMMMETVKNPPRDLTPSNALNYHSIKKVNHEKSKKMGTTGKRVLELKYKTNDIFKSENVK